MGAVSQPCLHLVLDTLLRTHRASNQGSRSANFAPQSLHARETPGRLMPWYCLSAYWTKTQLLWPPLLI